MTDAHWIGLDGAVNTRDLGGLPTVDGGLVLPDRLIRSDNLQGLTPGDVRLLVDGPAAGDERQGGQPEGGCSETSRIRVHGCFRVPPPASAAG